LISISEHAVAVAAKLIEISSSAHLHPDNKMRNQAVIAVKNLLDITLEQMERNQTLFLAAQVISDLEEFWESPFGSIQNVHPGSGASWFLGTYWRGLPPTKKKAEVMTNTMICENIVQHLQECSTKELACLGYYADELDDGQVHNKLNHCLITANNGEHKSCKGGIWITHTLPSYHISCQIAPLQPSFHPLRCNPGWPIAGYNIAHEAIHAFDQLVLNKKWLPIA
jgi:hypothetical protein